MKQDKVETMVYWIAERERIRRAKEAGLPKPWTRDALLLDYRWCNVRREDDRVSRWLLGEWYRRMLVEGAETIASAALARLVNWPDSLADVADLDGARAVLRARAAQGDKVFTGAYIVPGVPGRTKVDSVCDTVDALRPVRPGATMRGTWEALRAFPGLGSFLAGQIVADVAILNDATGEAHWPDADSWAPVGPGSARGLNRLLGRPFARAVPQGEFDEELPRVVEMVRRELPAIFEDRGLVAMDVQGCLCEFDKYERLTFGEGTVRAGYDGRAPRGFFA